MKTIIYIITGMGTGGAERQVEQLALGMQRIGWNVVIVSMINVEAKWPHLEMAGIPIVSLQMRRGVPSLAAVGRFARILNSFKPAVVHSHMIHANIFARVACRLFGFKALVCTAHHYAEGGMIKMLWYRLTDRFAAISTHVSRSGLDRYRKIRAYSSERSAYIGNGLDVSKYSSSFETRNAIRGEFLISEKTFVWLSVGRLVAIKDVSTMLRACSLLKGQASDWVLLVAGTGDDYANLLRLSAELGLSDRVRFLGMRSDVGALMAGADAFVMSSRLEGLPMVLLEAGAGGLPLISTDFPGASEIVVPFSNGLLVPVSDCVSLSDAMLRVMRLSVDDRRHWGRRARELVESKYGLNIILDKWNEIYKKIE